MLAAKQGHSLNSNKLIANFTNLLLLHAPLSFQMLQDPNVW